MKTGELIHILAQAPQPPKPVRLSVFFAAFFLAAAAVTFVVLGYRPALMALDLPVGFWVKSLALSSLAALALLFLKQESVPLHHKSYGWLFGLYAAGFAALIGWEWATTAPDVIISPAYLGAFLHCIFFVSLYSVAGMTVLVRIMRRYAPADPRKAAGLVGLAAATTGALGYSLHCTMDGPTYILLAYGLPCLTSWLAARRFLAPFLNW